MLATFSEYFGLNKSQAELDFVDIELEGDIPLYVDPYALSSRDDEWSITCHAHVVSFFQTVIDAINQNDTKRGTALLSRLGEPEETHLGVSQNGNKGRGIGPAQAAELFSSLRKSKAAQSTVLEDLPDFALYIPGIGRDKISDITTNIIRGGLIAYTQAQCNLHGVPMLRVASGFYWDMEKQAWGQDYVDLPICNKKKVLLVPKYTVRYQVGVDHAAYRSHFVLEFLQEEHKRADDSLVTAIKNKKGEVIRKTVFKKDVDAHYPKDKDFLADFSQAHPEIIQSYKTSLLEKAKVVPDVTRGIFIEGDLAMHLINRLSEIPPGKADADRYHTEILGIISFMFFPNLIYPQKEAQINDGRKRIDILYTNGKDHGFFQRIAFDQNIKANFIPVECKNYTSDIANPEFDQLLGRFDRQRGKLGFLFYRKSDKPDHVLARCRDAAKSDIGIVLPIDDTFILESLELIRSRQRPLIDQKLNALYRSIVS